MSDGLPKDLDDLRAACIEGGFELLESTAVPDWWDEAVGSWPLDGRLLGFMHWASPDRYRLVVAAHLTLDVKTALAVEADRIIEADRAQAPHEEWTWMSDGTRSVMFCDLTDRPS